MKSSSRVWLWVGLLVAVILGLIWQFYPLTDAQQRLEKVPLAGPGFVGKDVPLTPFEEDFFKKINVLKRVYRVENHFYFVTALDGTHNRHLVHDPYYCFTGSGWSISSSKEISIPQGAAQELEIAKSGQKKTALFWFTNGSESYTSPWKYWWESTLRRLSLGRSRPEPILVMVQPLDNTTDVDWNQVLKFLTPVFKSL